MGFSDNATAQLVSLAERWNGSKWVIQKTPSPSGGSKVSLSSVACPTATACLAVGSYTNSSGVQVPLAERWNGKSWALKSPAGAASGGLSSVACTSVTSCIAVGSTGATPNSPRAERWNGKTWTALPVLIPATATGGALYSIACTAATACTAVGSYSTAATTAVALAETWNGSSWSLAGATNPMGATTSVLYSVSCTSVCTAVGSADSATLAEVSAPTTWLVQPTPAIAGSTVLASVSCTSAMSCVAVGDDNTGSSSAASYSTIGEHWDGAVWSLESTPDPA